MTTKRMILTILLGAALSPSTAQAQTTWYVDCPDSEVCPNVCADPGSGTEADPFCRIQDAINASDNGDEVVVLPGRCCETINYNGLGITLRSSDGAEATIIDGTGMDDSVVKCISGEGEETVLLGFTITGGTGNSSVCGPCGPIGGGMVNFGSSPTVINCVFDNNTGDAGGGMYNRAGSEPTVVGCTFSNNTALTGGGLFTNSSSPIITNCKFVGNEATIGPGGGMYNNGVLSNPSVINCLFAGNTATDLTNTGTGPWGGGGMFNSGGSPTVMNCTFIDNSATPHGGGLYNQGGSHTEITNCIFWGNSDEDGMDESAQIHFEVEPDSTPVVTYSCIEGCDLFCAVPDDNNFGDDCLLDGARLSPGSPCIDSGDNLALLNLAIELGGLMPPGDLDGNARFWDDHGTPDTGNGRIAVIDRGAYEFRGIQCPADFNGDGVVDAFDLAILLGSWGICLQL